MYSYYNHNFKDKYHVKKITILAGFLSLFGLGDNPYKKAIEATLRRSDFDALRSDWNTVGQDFSRVIEKENLKLDACK